MQLLGAGVRVEPVHVQSAQALVKVGVGGTNTGVDPIDCRSNIQPLLLLFLLLLLLEKLQLLLEVLLVVACVLGLRGLAAEAHNPPSAVVGGAAWACPCTKGVLAKVHL